MEGVSNIACPLFEKVKGQLSRLPPRFMVSVKVADRNHESRKHKPSGHVEMFATKSATSSQQTGLCRSNGINLARYNARGKSATNSATKSTTTLRQSRGLVVDTIMKVGNVICVADFYDFCPRLCRELSGLRR